MERAWKWIHTTFPERQIYIRSDGRVQFFTFGPSLQATLAGLTLIFLGWVAFATVNVIFKDRIIAAKDHRYQKMQAAYENKVADLQISYDELNAALVSAEDRFKATADALQTKQNAIAGFLNRASQVQNMEFIGQPGDRAQRAVQLLALAHQFLRGCRIVPERGVFSLGVQFVQAAVGLIPVKDASSAGQWPAGCHRQRGRFRDA